jgi:hypothetical protein
MAKRRHAGRQGELILRGWYRTCVLNPDPWMVIRCPPAALPAIGFIPVSVSGTGIEIFPSEAPWFGDVTTNTWSPAGSPLITQLMDEFVISVTLHEVDPTAMMTSSRAAASPDLKINGFKYYATRFMTNVSTKAKTDK